MKCSTLQNRATILPPDEPNDGRQKNGLLSPALPGLFSRRDFVRSSKGGEGDQPIAAQIAELSPSPSRGERVGERGPLQRFGGPIELGAFVFAFGI